MLRAQETSNLCERVRKAFSGVVLGGGIGLFEGQAIDNYETSEVRAKRREKDEKTSWEKIEVKHLNACCSSLSFTDALGMRFHLPAFIVAELNGEYGQGLVYTLTHVADYSPDKFGLLSPGQRQVVREYLQFLRADPDNEFNHADIDRALSEYWKPQS